MTLRRDGCRADPAYRPWSLRAIGLAASGEMIGHIGFHTRPDPPYLKDLAPGAVEVRRCISTYDPTGLDAGTRLRDRLLSGARRL